LLGLGPVRNVEAQLPSVGTQGWYTGNVWVRFPSHFRFLGTTELNAATNYSYQQWIVGGAVAYQWKRVSHLEHLVNINSDKESRVVAGLGFEYLWTDKEGTSTGEDRLVLAATPRYRPWRRWLLEDRNRFEFRWVDGVYSTRYRNRLAVERDLLVRDFRFTPYASAEIFYSFSSGTVDEERYEAGIQWPYRRLFMVETYYLYQHSHSSPDNVNVFGITLNVYLRNSL
jgi:hypothetical protein